VILISIAVVAITLYLVGWPERSKVGPPLPVKRRRIAALHLTTVREKAMRRHGWDEATSTSLEADYRDFLMLLAENDGLMVSPWSDDLDLFWHEHILDTRRYAADCGQSSDASSSTTPTSTRIPIGMCR
jgi:hypothetical protein